MSGEKLNTTNNYELSATQEKRLFTLIEKGKKAEKLAETNGINPTLQREISRGKQAKNTLIEGHITFVKRMCHLTLHTISDDLLSEGILGLYDALEGFNPNREGAFVNYAWGFVKNRLLKYYAAENNHESSQFNYDKKKKIKEAEDEFIVVHRRKPTTFELQEACGLSDKQFNDPMLAARWQELDKPIYSSDGTCGEFHNIVPDMKTNTEDKVEEKMLYNTALANFDKLSNDERQVMIMYFGINGCPETSIKDIANQLQISSAKVYKLRSEALDKLKECLCA